MREFFNKPAGKIVAVALVLIGLAFCGWIVYGTVGPSDIAKLSRDRVYIDSVTGKPFEYTVQIGDKNPVAAPSGGRTGYPAELCFWTKDGKPKSDPTPVLLNATVGKPGPTFCPDCGRLVVGHNPPALAGGKAPPTRGELEASGDKSASPPESADR